MSSSTTGKRGEDMAAEYLDNNGFHIIDRNWAAGRGVHCVGEIDIIAQKDDRLHFVEVKCRANNAFSNNFAPHEAFTDRKAERFMRAAESYIRENETSEEVSIDLITVNVPPEGVASIRHYIGIV